jgi:hypothetical protein
VCLEHARRTQNRDIDNGARTDGSPVKEKLSEKFQMNGYINTYIDIARYK